MAGSTFTQIDLLSLVLKADPDYYEPEIAYRFSNGRTFIRSEPYAGAPAKAILDRDGNPILDRDGNYILSR